MGWSSFDTSTHGPSNLKMLIQNHHGLMVTPCHHKLTVMTSHTHTPAAVVTVNRLTPAVGGKPVVLIVYMGPVIDLALNWIILNVAAHASGRQREQRSL